jgi:hypothetical protein
VRRFCDFITTTASAELLPRAHHDQVSFDAAWAAGRTLTLEQAVAYVLEVILAEIKRVHSVA